MKKINKKMALIAGCSTVATIAIAGTGIAFLSDRKNPPKQEMNIGTVDLKDVNITLKPSSTTSSDLSDNIIDGNGNLTNLNPGDKIPISFDVENNGSKSIEQKTYVYIIFNNNDGSSKTDFSDGSNYGIYSNFINSISVTKGTNPTTLNFTKGVYTDKNNKKYVAIRIDLPSSIINGTEEKETTAVTKTTYNFNINFDINANVHTQEQSLQIKTYTQSIQYRNTNSQNLTDLINDSSFFKAT